MFNRPLSRMPTTSSLAHNDGWRWLDRGQLLPLPIYWPLTGPINRLLCLLGSWSTRLLNNVMTPFILPTPHILECPTCRPARFSQDHSHLFLRNKNTKVLNSSASITKNRWWWWPYLIFVIFFTQAKFLENKIYTEKTRKLRQNTQ